MTRRRFRAVRVMLVALLGLIPAATSSKVIEPAVRVLVKVRTPLAKDIEAALPTSTMVLGLGESGSVPVEAFLGRHSARKIAPLYPEIVKLKKARGQSDFEISTTIRQRFAKRANRLRATFQPPEISRTYVLELDKTPRTRVAEVLNALRADPDVEFAEEDQIVSTSFTPNDPYFSSSGSWGQSYDDLWGIKKIGAPVAWDTSTGAGVIVAVVDTGIDYNHPDIASNVWINTGEIPGNGIDDDHNGYVDDVRGWDFIGSTYTNPQQSNDPIDHFGHGTHVAGTIAAVGNNGIGVIGVAWHAQVMAVKALDDQGQGLDSTLGPAILYAANNGADVINASWGGPGSSQTIADAVNYAYNLGVVFVAAAGNSGEDARNFYPAALWNIITVGASDPNDNLATFSNFGSKIDVTAPGVDILSLQAAGTNMGPIVSPGYIRASGTSMATPHVAGLAALILSQNANYSNEDVRQVLRVSATDLGSPGYDLTYGYGRVNASAALGVTGVLEAKINSPVDGTVAQGVITISGVARGSGFSHYTLEYGPGVLPTAWTTIQATTTPTSGTLGVLDASSLANGVYDIRLTAYNTSGQAFVDRIQLAAHTVFILSPVPPPAPTSSTTFKNGATIPITGSALGGAFQDFQVAWAPGLDAPSGWQTTGLTLAGGGLSPVTNGLLASWDTSSIGGAGYYTIRLTVNTAGTSSQALTMVYFEPSLTSNNWPQLLDQGTYFSAGVLPAVSADGSLRLVAQSPVNGPGVGKFWTLTPNSTPQQTLMPGLGSFQQPAVADLDGKPGEEAVVADSGSIDVFREDNTSYSLASTTTLDYQRSQIVIEDLAGDSHWETLALGSDYNSQLAYVSAWRADGSQLNNNFPIQIADQNPVKTWYNRMRLLAGDLNGDGQKEIVVQEGLSSTTFTLRLFGNDGSPRAWSVPVITGIPEAMVAADLDHNGKLETILALYSGSQAILHVFQPDGTERTGWPQVLPNPNQYSQSFLAVGDLNRDGHREIVYSHEAYLYVFTDGGTIFSNAWPLQTGAPTSVGYGSLVIGDVDGDGFPEIVTTLNSVAFSSDPFFGSGFYYDEKLLAIRGNGTIARSWQLTGRNGYSLYAYPAPAIGDFNQDGITDIAVAYAVSGAAASVPAVVTMVSTGAKFNPAANDWPFIHQNPRNTNVLQSPTAYSSSSKAVLTTSVNPSVFGQQATFTATVAPQPNAPGANTPTGQVAFLDGGANLGSCTLASGVCTLATSSLSLGTHTITGEYLGDAHFTVSTSPALSQVVVNQAGSSTALTASVNPSVFGQQVTFTATVAPQPNALGANIPTGQATFFDGGANLGSCTLASASCTLATSSLQPGTHTITGEYMGDVLFAGSTSPGLSQVVNQAGSTTTLTASVNPSAFGQQVTFTATVAPQPNALGANSPTGQVTLFDGGANLGSCTLASGVCTFATSSLAPGTHAITGGYLGDAHFGVSTSPSLSEMVNRISSVTTLSINVNPSIVGQSVTLTATVAAIAPGNITPTGTIAFYDAAVSIGTAALTATGQATLTVTNFTQGSHNITAIYGGDSAFAGSTTSAVTSQVVNGPDFSLSASSAQTVNAGASATYTVTVSPNPPPFNHAVTNFSCTGLPTGAACSFNPTSVTPGSNSATTTLTISTMSRTLALASLPGESRQAMFATWLSAGILGFVGIVAVPGKQQRQKMRLALAIMVLGSALGAGCGGGSSQGNLLPPPSPSPAPSPAPSPSPNPSGTPAGTYNVTVTATGNGNVTHNTAVVLTVN